MTPINAKLIGTKSPPSSGFNTVIGADMHIEGKVNCDDSARIDGLITGPVNVALRLVTSLGSLITGNISGDVVEIGGRVVGDIEGREVRLSRTASVHGNISCEKLETESGAVIEGRVIMDQSSANNPFEVPLSPQTEAATSEVKKTKKAE